MSVVVQADAGTTYTFPTGQYWEEVNDGRLIVYGAHGGDEVRELDTFDSWTDVHFSEE